MSFSIWQKNTEVIFRGKEKNDKIEQSWLMNRQSCNSCAGTASSPILNFYHLFGQNYYPISVGGELLWK